MVGVKFVTAGYLDFETLPPIELNIRQQFFDVLIEVSDLDVERLEQGTRVGVA